MFEVCARMPAEDVVVYTARMAGSADVDSAVAFPVVRDGSRTLLPTRRVARSIAGVARAYGCDRVVFGAAAPLALLARGLRRRTTITHATAITHGHEVWWATVPGARTALRRIGDDVDVVTYVSEFCRARITRALSPSAVARMQRLSPWVDQTRFRPGLDGRVWRVRLGIPANRPVVLAASRLVRRKGHDALIEAWPRVLQDHPDAVLVVVGDGPSRQRLARLSERRGVAGSVVMVPGVAWDHMPQVYAMADVFALPCRTRRWGMEPEAFGIVYLEAAACGLPVITGNSGGAPEAARQVGGIVVDGRDVSAVAAVLIRALTSSR